MRSLRFHGVYVPDSARPDVADVKPIPNVYTAGLQALAGPLAEYNATFLRLKEQRAMKPAIGQSALQTYGIPRAALSQSGRTSVPPATAEGIGGAHSAGDTGGVGDSGESSDSGPDNASDSGSSSDEGGPRCDSRPGYGEPSTSQEEFFSLETAGDLDLDAYGF